MNRPLQCILILSTILGSWIGMQMVHELGHVIGARVTGGRVDRVVLDPLTFSRTDLAANPRPLVVVWAGPVVGVVVPLLLWGISAKSRFAGAFVVRFFTGFCLIANGLYVGIGSLDRVGDCGEMLRHGSSLWQLWLFGIVTTPAGLWLWHRQGAAFGFGTAANGRVRRDVAYGTLAACVLLVLLGFLIGGD